MTMSWPPTISRKSCACFTPIPGSACWADAASRNSKPRPLAWVRAFDDLIACRDLGETPLVSTGLLNPATGRKEYPACAPIGAGMALRREAADAWLARRAGNGHVLPDRKGTDLSSSGDKDIVLCAMAAGWEAAYFPTLSLTHLIPTTRTTAGYLARLNRGIQKSWMQVLALHGANTWPPLSPLGVRLRQAKAWFGTRA